MKYGLLFLVALTATPAVAQNYSYLEVHSGGAVYSYQGDLVHLHAEGLGGTIALSAAWPASVTQIEEDGPSQTGSWEIIVNLPDGSRTEQTLQCAADVAVAADCSTVKLTCVAPATSRPFAKSK